MVYNKADSSLHSQYAEARTSAALMVRKSKMQSWENIRHANMVFWQTIWHFRGKRSHNARSIKDQNGVLLSNEKDILGRWKEYFKIS